MNTLPSTYLNDVYALLKDPKHWTKKAFARDINGETTRNSEQPGCSWCLLGAIRKVGRKSFPKDIHDVAELIGNAIQVTYPRYGKSIVTFNDAHATIHEDIMAVLEQAIYTQKAQSNGR